MFKVETHAHTAQVSACSRIEAERLVRAYADRGYDALVITDHMHKYFVDNAKEKTWGKIVSRYLSGYEAAKKAGKKYGVRVYLGMELTCSGSRDDFLLYGITKEFLLANENIYNKKISEVRKIADANNVLIIQAHPFRDICTPAPAELLDGVEAFNGHFGQSSQNHKAREMAKSYGKLMLSGSDCHGVVGVGNGGISFETDPGEDFVAALKTMPFELITSEPQGLNIMAIKATDFEMEAPYEIFEMARANDAELIIISYDGEEKEVLLEEAAKQSIKTVIAGVGSSHTQVYAHNRCQIAVGKENAENLASYDPAVLVCTEAEESSLNGIEGEQILLVIGERSTAATPYISKGKAYVSFDMLKGCPKAFLACVTGPHVRLREITF